MKRIKGEESQMEDSLPDAPLCQSCGMPMGKAEDFGLSSDGMNREYCHFCWRDGHFIQPDITLTAMIDRCVNIMAAAGVMSAESARALMERMLPTLKRWR